MTEKQIENSILSYLKARGVFCWKNETTGIWDPKRKVFRKKRSVHRMVGVADILGIYKGRFLAIEVKSAKGRLTKDQKRFGEMVIEQGGIFLVARSIDDVNAGLTSPVFPAPP